MNNFERKEPDNNILVQDSPIISLDIPVIKTPRTKKRIRRIADPHLEGRKINGSLYYYYRRGIDKPIYLGSADVILRAVKGGK